MDTKTILTKPDKTRKILWKVTDSIPEEILIYCPGCKALDVIRFSGQKIIPTRKFQQRDDKVFHTCGTNIPCRLHRLGGRAEMEAESHLTQPRLPSPPTRRVRVREVVQV